MEQPADLHDDSGCRTRLRGGCESASPPNHFPVLASNSSLISSSLLSRFSSFSCPLPVPLQAEQAFLNVSIQIGFSLVRCYLSPLCRFALANRTEAGFQKLRRTVHFDSVQRRDEERKLRLSTWRPRRMNAAELAVRSGHRSPETCFVACSSSNSHGPAMAGHQPAAY